MSAFYAALSMAVSAATERKAVASASILGLLIGSAAVANGLVEGGGLDARILLADLGALPRELTYRIHNEFGAWPPRDISDGLIWLTAVGVIRNRSSPGTRAETLPSWLATHPRS